MDIHPDHPDLGRLAAEDQVVAYFGYGSLVNRLTLRTKFLAIRRAEVRGWRRFWVPRSGDGEPALLSVSRDEAETLHGVVVYDHADHLPSVDEREIGYARRIVDLSRIAIERPPLSDIPVFIYEAASLDGDSAEPPAPILQSYLDAVLAGFHALYGEAGVRRFVERTRGFDTVVITDRATPRYPRAVRLTAEEAALFDRLVSEAGARFASTG